MTSEELIAVLKDEENPNILDYIDEAVTALEAQQQRIAELEAELVEERHRHDRYVGFVLAQAKELARIKADLKEICQGTEVPCGLCAYGAPTSACIETDFNCWKCPTPCPCLSCDNNRSNWEWRDVRQEGKA